MTKYNVTVDKDLLPCISSYEMRLMQRPQVRGSEYTA